MIRRLVILFLFAASFGLVPSVVKAEKFDILATQMIWDNQDTHVEAWAPSMEGDQLQIDSAWFATLRWMGISIDTTCDEITIPKGISYIIWNTVTKGEDGAYWLDGNHPPTTGTADKKFKIRACWGYLTRHVLPTDIKTFLSSEHPIVPTEYLTWCIDTCTTLTDVDPIADWTMRVISYASQPDQCPSWTLGSNTTGIYASEDMDTHELVWNVARGGLITQPLQPGQCAVMWFFRSPKPQTQQG